MPRLATGGRGVLFNSLAFGAFLPLFLAGYFLSRGRVRLIFCLLASYLFYGWWDWRFLPLLMATSLFNYGLGLAIAACGPGLARRFWLTVALAGNLSVIGLFKYLDFLAGALSDLLAPFGLVLPVPGLSLVLPVGISFFTFQALSYVIDVYRGTIAAAERDPVRFATYIALFPQLVAGPIVRARDLLPQLAVDHGPDPSRLARGAEQMAWGFFLKLCLADNAARYVEPRFAEPALFNGFDHLAGVFVFALQIYGDFAGYSLIAIGLGRIMGFDFGVNFRRPYFATGFSDFWRRWHISLSRWLRDYLYVPLGGNRGGRLKTLRNLVITMALGGLWHGAAWTFVAWGLLHGAYLVLERLLEPVLTALAALLRLPVWLRRLLAGLMVFALTCFAWLFFRAESFADAWSILEILGQGQFTPELGRQTTMLARTLAAAALVLAVDVAATQEWLCRRYLASPALRVLGFAILVWGICLNGAFDGSAFIYFQF